LTLSWASLAGPELGDARPLEQLVLYSLFALFGLTEAAHQTLTGTR
jgi:hypothetical protein